MNRETFNRLIRNWKFDLLFLVILLLLVAVGIALYKPEALPEQVGPLNVQDIALQNGVTGDFAMQQFDAWYIKAEEDIPPYEVKGRSISEMQMVPSTAEVNLLNSHSVALSGRTRVVLIKVLTTGQTNSQIQPAVTAADRGFRKVTEAGNSQLTGVLPSLSHIIQEEQVVIPVDPYDVVESEWVEPAAKQLHPNCPYNNGWSCFLDFLLKQKQEGDHSVVGALLTVRQPIRPGESYHIGAYCRRALCVMSAEDNYTKAGHGECMAAHEWGHAFGARHPTDQTGVPLGYFGIINVLRNDVMHSILSCIISDVTLGVMGHLDRDGNKKSDITQSSTVLNVTINGVMLAGTIYETPVEPAQTWLLGRFTPHLISKGEVKVGNGPWQEVSPNDGSWGSYSEGFSFSLVGIPNPSVLRVRANLNGKFVEQSIQYGEIEFDQKLYLPLIRR